MRYSCFPIDGGKLLTMTELNELCPAITASWTEILGLARDDGISSDDLSTILEECSSE
jgi:hypothetical protein